MDSKYVVRTFQSIDLKKTMFINDLRQKPRKKTKTQVGKTQKPITQKPGFLGSGFLGSANPDQVIGLAWISRVYYQTIQ